jgi:gluconokinase
LFVDQVAAREAQRPFAFALDVGTSGVRAALYDVRAREIAGTHVRRERAFDTTAGGGSEIDAEAAFADVVRVVDAALQLAGELTASVESVAISCFWHSLVGVGRDGRALTPVLGWADTRAVAGVEELRRLADELSTHARTGCRFHPGYWPAKILWLRRTRADIVRDVYCWMSFGEFIALRLSGQADARATTASISQASGTGLLNQHTRAWDGPLLAALQLDAGQLPRLPETGAATFELAGEYAARWTALRRSVWFAAVGDGAANNVGAGCVTRDEAALMVGTSGAMRLLFAGDPPASLPESLWCYRADARRVVVGGALSDGGGLYGWMRRALAFDESSTGKHGLHLSTKAGERFDAQALEDALASLEPDAHGLTVLPFWAGERSTGWNADARGAILGLTMHTRPLEILRAGLEAIAYRFALVADALSNVAPFAQIRASGGALVASPVWTQIIADALGRPVQLADVREASSRGAVLLALEAQGEIKSIAEMSATPITIYEPDASRHARYAEAVERQEKFYQLLVNHS